VNIPGVFTHTHGKIHLENYQQIQTFIYKIKEISLPALTSESTLTVQIAAMEEVFYVNIKIAVRDKT
jgi:hypothetical protein